MSKNKILNLSWNEIVVFSEWENDFISLTDLMKSVEWNQKIEKWIWNRWTIDFLWAWETMHNPNFDFESFSKIRLESGTPSFTMSVTKWNELTKSIWIISKKWKFWWTYAHKDIAFKFAWWLSPQFELYVIKEFQRLKELELKNNELWWDVKRLITKANYRIHTDSIKANLIGDTPKNIQKFIYIDEAELLNKALFWMTSKEWKQANPKKAEEWNIRDFADIEQLQVLSNLEVLNSDFIDNKITAEERFERLKSSAKKQLESFNKLNSINKLKEKEELEKIKKLWLS